MPYESIVIWGCGFTFILIPQTDQLVKLNSKLLIALLCVPVSSALEKQFVSVGNGQVIEWRPKPNGCRESFGGAEWTQLSVTLGDVSLSWQHPGCRTCTKRGQSPFQCRLWHMLPKGASYAWETPRNQIIFCTEYSNEVNFNKPHSFARNWGMFQMSPLFVRRWPGI